MVCCAILHNGPGDVQASASNQFCQPVSDKTVFKDCRVFDGENEALLEHQDVIVQKNIIVKIAPTGTEEIVDDDNTLIIECGGNRVLMPGMIDCHWHTMLALLSQNTLFTADAPFMAIIAAAGSKDTLLRGFTTVRDAGANCFAVKRAIDGGHIEGPRIYPCGPLISQTSGHFDFRAYNDVPSNPGEPLNYLQRNGHYLLADGVPEVLKRTREALRMGATQIKIAGGGGVSSPFDPIDVSEFIFEEVKAAVDAAKSWNTYVCAHVYTDVGIRTCVEAGVISIEHGQLASKETLQLMKEKGSWLSFQPILDDEDATWFAPGSFQKQKFHTVAQGTLAVGKMAKEMGVKLAWGTDTLFDPELAKKQGKQLTKMHTTFNYEPWETLKLAMSNNAKLVKLCGPRDPYPGDLGVIREGALADMILVDGNPLEDLMLITDPGTKFVVIMKDGKVYKNMFGPV